MVLTYMAHGIFIWFGFAWVELGQICNFSLLYANHGDDVCQKTVNHVTITHNYP